MQRVGDVDVEAGRADRGTGVVEHPVAGDDDTAGVSGGIDDAVPTAERLSLEHVVEDGRNALSVFGVLVLQQQFRGGLDFPGFVAVHARDRIRPLPTLVLQEVAEPAYPLRLTQTEDQIDRAQPVLLDYVRHERLARRPRTVTARLPIGTPDSFIFEVHGHRASPLPLNRSIAQVYCF